MTRPDPATLSALLAIDWSVPCEFTRTIEEGLKLVREDAEKLRQAEETRLRVQGKHKQGLKRKAG